MKIIDDEALSPLSSGNIKEDMKFWIFQFIEQKEIERVAPKTLKSYKDALNTFMCFVEKYKDNTMESVGAKFINRYLIEYQATLAKEKIKKLKAENKIDELEKYDKIISQQETKFLGKNDANFIILKDFENSLDHRLTVVKMLLKYISDNNEEEHDYTVLFRKFTTIRHTEVFTSYITLDEFDEVVALMNVWMEHYKEYKPKSSIQIAYRDSMLLLLYALTGARSEEIVKVKLEDITPISYNNKDYYRIKIKEGKGNKIREVAIESAIIKKHIDYFEHALPSKEYYISSTFICGQYTNKPQHQDNIRRFSNYILKILGIKKSGLHVFRRGYATKRIMYDGAELSMVAKEMGNTSAVLEKYYVKHESLMSVQ